MTVDGRVYKSEKTFKTASMAQQNAAYQVYNLLFIYLHLFGPKKAISSFNQSHCYISTLTITLIINVG